MAPHCGAMRMEGEQNMAQSPDSREADLREARLLLRAARVASLATLEAGAPFVSLVTPATAPDLTPLLLLSSLAAHTRHLRADPRCSLLVVEAPTGPNPQTAPRVTLTGVARAESDPALRERWVGIHPAAATYAQFADFRIWSVVVAEVSFVGGFGRARRFNWSELLPDLAKARKIAGFAADIILQCNRHCSDAIQAIASERETDGSKMWTMIGIDTDGCDLGSGVETIRIAWDAPVTNPGEVEAALSRLQWAALSNHAGNPQGP